MIELIIQMSRLAGFRSSLFSLNMNSGILNWHLIFEAQGTAQKFCFISQLLRISVIAAYGALIGNSSPLNTALNREELKLVQYFLHMSHYTKYRQHISEAKILKHATGTLLQMKKSLFPLFSSRLSLVSYTCKSSVVIISTEQWLLAIISADMP